MTIVRAENAFTERPTNTAGTIGQNVTLNCAVSDRGNSVAWLNPSSHIVYEKEIGITPGNEGHYVVERGIGKSYHLVVLNTEVDDAGQYECRCGRLTSLFSAFAEVILLGLYI